MTGAVYLAVLIFEVDGRVICGRGWVRKVGVWMWCIPVFECVNPLHRQLLVFVGHCSPVPTIDSCAICPSCIGLLSAESPTRFFLSHPQWHVILPPCLVGRHVPRRPPRLPSCGLLSSTDRSSVTSRLMMIIRRLLPPRVIRPVRTGSLSTGAMTGRVGWTCPSWLKTWPRLRRLCGARLLISRAPQWSFRRSICRLLLLRPTSFHSL